MKRTPIDSRLAGIRNEKLVLNLLRENEQLSQTQLCKMTGLGSSTSSYIVARLREKDLILEEQGKSKKRGAKPTIIKINPKGRYIVSVDINPDKIITALFDMACKMIEKIETNIDKKDHPPEKIAKKIELFVHGLISKNNVPQDKILGIGITLSGTIKNNEYVELSSPMGWKNVPLKDILKEKFSCPINIYTTRVRLLAEFSLQPELKSKNILYINVANGVGCTAIIDGKILEGATGRSGEIGHIIIDPEGPECGCGHKGCLEAFISGPAIAEKIQNEKSKKSSLLETMISKSNSAESVIAAWKQAIEQNDILAKNILDSATEKFSKAVSIAINFYDPSIVMLAGYVPENIEEHFINAFNGKMKTDVYNYGSRDIEIISAKAGQDALINGCANAILEDSLKI